MISAFLFLLSLNPLGHASASRPLTFNGIDGSTALSNTPPAAGRDKRPNITPLLGCESDGRPPKISDCAFLVNSHIRDSDFRDTYRYGQAGNYSGPYTWRHNECEFELVVKTGQEFKSSLHSIFGMALFVGTTCADHDTPGGGSAILNPLREGRAVMYVRRPQGSSLPSIIDASSAYNGIANLSNPAIHSRSCVPRYPGPDFNDCVTLFMEETSKPDSTTIQTFGAQGTYTGPYSWVHGACEFQLGMNGAPLLSTTLAWIFQTAVRVMLECTKHSPPEGGFVLLDDPHRGAIIKALRPPTSVSQQNRSLPLLKPPPRTLTIPGPIFNNTPSESLQCVPSMMPPDQEDCFMLRATHINQPDFKEPQTLGPHGTYTGPYAWTYGHCRFSLAVVGACSWQASISEVFALAALVWWECGRFTPPQGGYLKKSVCEGKTSVFVWAGGIPESGGGVGSV